MLITYVYASKCTCMLYTQHTIQYILVGTKLAIPSSSEYTSGFYGLVTKQFRFPGASINN